MSDYRNVSNPAAFGIEWTAGDHGNRYQLVNSRGTSSLMFGMWNEDQQRWYSTSVVAPERFGMTQPPRSFKDFLKIAKSYIED